MITSDRLETFVRAWRKFLRVDADLDAIFDKYRPGVAAPDDSSQAGGTMTQADGAEVARLQAEIARLAPMLAAMGLPTSAPIVQPTAKEVIQAYRLAGWPQWKIDRKLAGEQFAQLDRRMGLLLVRHGVDRYAVVTRDQIAALQIAERDRQELLGAHDAWARAGAEVERLSTMVEPKSGRTAAGHEAVAAWCQCVGKAEALCNMRAALQDLEDFPVAHPGMKADPLEPLLASAAEQILAREALEVAPADAALRQLGFGPQSADGPDLRWEGTEWGRTMLVGAGPGRKGNWAVTGWHKVADEWQQQNAELAAHEQRGKVAATLLSMWRQAFGRAVRPPGALDLGRIYEQQRERFGRPDMSLPRLELDGPAFRAMRQRLRRGFGHNPDALANLAVSEGALRVSVAGSTFTVQARGGFGLGCEVALGDLIGIPPSCLRGGVIRMDRGWSVLTIAWYCIRIAAGAPSLAPGASPSGTPASQSGPGGDATGDDAERRPGNAEADKEDTWPDFRECFFTTDRSDSGFTLLGYFRCPLSLIASVRVERAGWEPDADGLIPASAFAGKFWWMRGPSAPHYYPGARTGTADDVLTTEELFAAIARGYSAIAMDGPFDTKEDGHYALDVAWESPDD